MTQQNILALTLAQFGLLQDPPIEDNTLRLIGTFASREPDTSPEALLWAETMKLASDVRTIESAFTSEKKGELEAAFRKRLDDETHRLGVTTVSDVIQGWFANEEKYSKREDWNWRNFQKIHIMCPFLEALQFLGFPQEDIQRLRESAEFVARWRPAQRDTSHDAGP